MMLALMKGIFLNQLNNIVYSLREKIHTVIDSFIVIIALRAIHYQVVAIYYGKKLARRA